MFKISETVVHPFYDSTTVDNDMALLRLPRPVELGTNITSVCLPNQGSSLPVGKQCTIIGWGKVKHSNFFGTEVLNEAQVYCTIFILYRVIHDLRSPRQPKLHGLV